MKKLSFLAALSLAAFMGCNLPQNLARSYSPSKGTGPGERGVFVVNKLPPGNFIDVWAVDSNGQMLISENDAPGDNSGKAGYCQKYGNEEAFTLNVIVKDEQGQIKGWASFHFPAEERQMGVVNPFVIKEVTEKDLHR